MYAIVDIETTGGYAAAGGITEISIQVLNGSGVVQRFETLVNPMRSIPPFITAMTGITNEMVQQAPLFEDIAPEVYEILKDKIFVAHSVNFDYSFIKSQLHYCGYELHVPKLCTVRLARKILPGCQSYSLGKLCHELGIAHTNRHRAGGDTDATVLLFSLLLAKDNDGYIPQSLKRGSKERVLPPHLPESDFEKLPYTAGVYYFHDEKGKVVYVGKAKNIRYRVNSHFTNNSIGRQKQNFLRTVHHISFEECGTELVAAVKESIAIKKLWPKFNAAQKKREDLYHIVCYQDQNNYLRLAVDKVGTGREMTATYHHIDNAKAALRQMVHQFALCPKLCFTEPELYPGNMHGVCCRGACEKNEPPENYNDRVLQAIKCMKNLPTFAIIDKGVHADEKSCILIWEGKFYGIGFISNDVQLSQPEAIKELVTPYKENSTITKMLCNYARRYPYKTKQLQH